ncbi:hypothetical protein ABTX34_15095 [Streptomyces sp. NPDC096538]|uniref:hypothetical protein n=1 Tax=Streptomyces sp. NPDC096538 TaxID=3155427 RepID=UPI00332BD776
MDKWSLLDEPAQKPEYLSVAAHLEAVHHTLTQGPADGMDPDVPGIVWGCLIWDKPEFPGLDEAAEHWAPLH